MNKEEDFQSALILAGGKSTRMGFDKQKLSIEEEPIIYKNIKELKSIFREVMVVTKTPENYRGLCDIILQDEFKEVGPLGGIHVGLKYCSSKYLMVMACDMPIIDKDYLLHLRAIGIKNNYKGLLGEKEGFLEPFPGFYSKDFILDIEENLSLEKRSIRDILKDNSIYVEKDLSNFNKDMFLNLNTLKDLTNYKKSILNNKEDDLNDKRV